MVPRNYILIILLVIVLQFTLSFFYSSEIINQNNFFERYKTELSSLQDQNQFLQNTYSKLTSLNELMKHIDINQYLYSSQKIDLNSNP